MFRTSSLCSESEARGTTVLGGAPLPGAHGPTARALKPLPRAHSRKQAERRSTNEVLVASDEHREPTPLPLTSHAKCAPPSNERSSEGSREALVASFRFRSCRRSWSPAHFLYGRHVVGASHADHAAAGNSDSLYGSGCARRSELVSIKREHRRQAATFATPCLPFLPLRSRATLLLAYDHHLLLILNQADPLAQSCNQTTTNAREFSEHHGTPE